MNKSVYNNNTILTNYLEKCDTSPNPKTLLFPHMPVSPGQLDATKVDLSLLPDTISSVDQNIPDIYHHA